MSKENAGFSPNIFSTTTKSGKRRKNRRARNIKDSIAKNQLFSIEKELGLEGLLEGNTAKQTVRIPLRFREAFKQECKANGTSTCKVILELQAIWFLRSRIQKTALSSTMSKIVEANFSIGEVNFTQNVQSRVRRNVGNNEGVELTVDGLSTCEFRGCQKVATDKAVYLKDKKERRVCKFHYANSCLNNPTAWECSK